MTKAFANLATIIDSFSLSSPASGLVSQELRSSSPQGANVLTRHGQEWPEGRPLSPAKKKTFTWYEKDLAVKKKDLVLTRPLVTKKT